MREKISVPTPDESERFDRLIDRMLDGESMTRAAKDLFGNVNAFYSLISRVQDMARRYARAQEMRADVFADQIIEIADTDEDANRARNRIQARQWLASKMNPRTYGDRIDLNVQQTISINDALTEARARILRPAYDQPLILDAECVDIPTLSAPKPTDNESMPGVADIFS